MINNRTLPGEKRRLKISVSLGKWKSVRVRVGVVKQGYFGLPVIRPRNTEAPLTFRGETFLIRFERFTGGNREQKERTLLSLTLIYSISFVVKRFQGFCSMTDRMISICAVFHRRNISNVLLFITCALLSLCFYGHLCFLFSLLHCRPKFPNVIIKVSFYHISSVR